VIHSFDGTAQDAEDYLNLGWMLSFNGMLTFKPKDYLREACRVVPDDRMLVETDSPFLAPVPLRGKRCDPSMLLHTAQMLADERGQSLEDVERLTTENARRLFAF
jgi:TatD DNase family protein